MKSLTVAFDVEFFGDRAAGLHPFTDAVTVEVDSGDVGDLEEFREHIRQSLEQWYDGASVTARVKIQRRSGK